MIGPISPDVKQMGARSAGNPHAACDVEGAGNVARSGYWDTRRRKGEPTGETNFGLNRRASPRPYRKGRSSSRRLRSGSRSARKGSRDRNASQGLAACRLAALVFRSASVRGALAGSAAGESRVDDQPNISIDRRHVLFDSDAPIAVVAWVVLP